MSIIRIKTAAVLMTIMLVTACGPMMDDLDPSGQDKRPPVVPGSVGGLPGQTAADFTLPLTDGGFFTLGDHVAGGSDPADAIVLYWTMWCPVCSGHMDQIQFNIIPLFAGFDVRYVVVDYVNSTVELAARARHEAGFGSSPFLVAADTSGTVTSLYNSTMGTTVVIAGSGTVRMNEDFRTGDNLISVLNEALTGSP